MKQITIVIPNEETEELELNPLTGQLYDKNGVEKPMSYDEYGENFTILDGWNLPD